MEKWKPAGQHNLIWDIQLSSLCCNHICQKLHLWSISTPLHMHLAISPMIELPWNLNNNLISYRHTVTQFTHLHLAARTLSVRTKKVLHTLEYGTPHSLTSLVMKAVEMWSNENSVSVKYIVYDWVCCVFCCYTMPYGLYLHLSPKDAIHNQKEQNAGGFFWGMGNILCKMCCIQNTA